MPSQSLKDFVDQLIEKKAFKDVEPEVKEQLRIDLEERLQDFLLKELLNEMSDPDLASFEQLIDSGANDDEVQKFISEHVENSESVLTAALVKFANLYV